MLSSLFLGISYETFVYRWNGFASAGKPSDTLWVRSNVSWRVQGRSLRGPVSPVTVQLSSKSLLGGSEMCLWWKYIMLYIKNVLLELICDSFFLAHGSICGKCQLTAIHSFLFFSLAWRVCVRLCNCVNFHHYVNQLYFFMNWYIICTSFHQLGYCNLL